MDKNSELLMQKLHKLNVPKKNIELVEFAGFMQTKPNTY